ncbi:hypothetical protein IWQ62_004764 [Dispira parvispora]|uniref:SAP domain-containing protein n=1 Tax=Dispira parvispora TaxID=1520584 RepID=A0A9W8E5B3_9FUNG|nr:hypothetical protein IWQ62_004764 [Dispira parvispora]
MDPDSVDLLQSPPLRSMRKTELKELAEQYQLSTEGLKSDLETRIRNHLLKSQPLVQSMGDKDFSPAPMKSPTRGRSRARPALRNASPSPPMSPRRRNPSRKTRNRSPSVEPKTPRRRRAQSPSPESPLSHVRQLKDKVVSLVTGDEEDGGNVKVGTPSKLTRALAKAKESEEWEATTHSAQHMLNATTDRLRTLTSSPASAYRALAQEFNLAATVQGVQQRFATPRKLLTLLLGAELLVFLIQSIPTKAVVVGPWKYYSTGKIMSPKTLWIPNILGSLQSSTFWTTLASWLVVMVIIPYVFSVMLRPAPHPVTETTRRPRESTSGGKRWKSHFLGEPSVFSVHPLTFALARFGLLYLFGDAAHVHSLHQTSGVKAAGAALTSLHGLTFLPFRACCSSHTGSWASSAVCVLTTSLHNLYNVVPMNLLMLTAIATAVFTFYDILERRVL